MFGFGGQDKKKLDIDAIILEAILRKEVVEVLIDGSAPVYHTYFVKLPKSVDSSRSLVIAPLEPAIGNSRLRRSKSVAISFCNGLENYATELIYEKSLVMPENAFIFLTYPTDLVVSVKRKSERFQIPPNFLIMAELSQKRERLCETRVIDLSGSGLMIECPLQESDYPVGTLVYMYIYPKNVSKLEPVEVHGEIRRYLQIRSEDGRSATRVCGIKFMKFSDQIEDMAVFLKKLHEKMLKELKQQQQ